MPLDKALKDLMITSGIYQNVASRDVYGKRTGGPAVSFNCHLTLIRNDVYGSEEVKTIPAGTMIMNGVYDIQKDAIITIEGLTVKATRVTTFFDEVGSNHTTVEFSG
jgi:hypothetical protein